MIPIAHLNFALATKESSTSHTGDQHQIVKFPSFLHEFQEMQGLRIQLFSNC
jgi:hypothetical protein